MLEIIQLESLKDNYIYLVRSNGKTAVVDPTEAAPVLKALEERDWKLDWVWNTHHHWDHVGGNLELKQKTGCAIWASEYDFDRTPGCDRGLEPGETIEFGDCRVEVIGVPGHTLGHVAFWFSKEKTLFPGDTLFSLGCGRLFEGTAAQMWETLSRLCDLPADTVVYSAHEYTLANASFALSLEPSNSNLLSYIEKAREKRKKGQPTVPFLLGEERAVSPFLRAKDRDLQEALGLITSGPVKVFAEVRRRKDTYIDP